MIMEKELQIYANEHNINDLSSEEIIKLMIKPYCIGEIAEAFNITEKEFKNIKKQKGINNIILENTIRNIETILDHLDSKNKYFSNSIRKQLVNTLLQIFLTSIPRKDFYIKKISEINFTREKVINDLKEKEIDKQWRLKSLTSIIIYIEQKMDNLIKKEKDYLLNDNHKKLYNYLKTEQDQGKIFKKENLTYDSLFELSIIERVSDQIIGSIYNMTKSQVRYQRKKLGLENIAKTKRQMYPESIVYLAEENNERSENRSNYEYEIMVNKINNIEKNKKEKRTPNTKDDDITIENNGEIETYHINFSNEKFETNPSKKSSNRKTHGSHHNYKNENETKRLHGKIGEQIALEAEKKRLKKLGLEDLIDHVQLISQISEDITLDGLGYDIISFNEKREKVCIEVKTSYSKKDKPFFISRKELELLQGLKEEHDCKNCLIYYLLINDNNVIIKSISPQEISNLKLKPMLYKVESKNNQENEIFI